VDTIPLRFPRPVTRRATLATRGGLAPFRFAARPCGGPTTLWDTIPLRFPRPVRRHATLATRGGLAGFRFAPVPFGGPPTWWTQNSFALTASREETYLRGSDWPRGLEVPPELEQRTTSGL
jgi:hypothetical protein